MVLCGLDSTPNASVSSFLVHDRKSVYEGRLNEGQGNGKSGAVRELNQSHSSILGSKGISSGKLLSKGPFFGKIGGNDGSRLVKDENEIDHLVASLLGAVPTSVGEHVLDGSYVREYNVSSSGQIRLANGGSIHPNSNHGVIGHVKFGASDSIDGLCLSSVGGSTVGKKGLCSCPCFGLARSAIQVSQFRGVVDKFHYCASSNSPVHSIFLICVVVVEVTSHNSIDVGVIVNRNIC